MSKATKLAALSELDKQVTQHGTRRAAQQSEMDKLLAAVRARIAQTGTARRPTIVSDLNSLSRAMRQVTLVVTHKRDALATMFQKAIAGQLPNFGQAITQGRKTLRA